MIKDAVGTKCIIDGEVRSINDLSEMDVSDEGAVYEVIRIISSVPLFYKDHMHRMQKSIELLGCEGSIDTAKIFAHIRKTVSENGLMNCNVKIVFYMLPDMDKFLLYVSKSYYPEESVYQKGVALATLKWDRNNPNTKRINHDYRTAVSEVIAKNDVFEALLISCDSIVTEGSRSNIFFIKDGSVYTAPKQLILEGITRKYVVKVCEELGIEVREREIKEEELQKFDAVFLTGTSIHVLPVSKVDKLNFDSGNNPTLVKIREAFAAMVEKNIKSGGVICNQIQK